MVVVYDTQEGYEQFRDGVLMPKMAEIEGGFTAPPKETTFEVFTQATA